MVDRGAAERACKDANPIIDGRKANVNLAYLGAKPRSAQTSEYVGSLRNTGSYPTSDIPTFSVALSRIPSLLAGNVKPAVHGCWWVCVGLFSAAAGHCSFQFCFLLESVCCVTVFCESSFNAMSCLHVTLKKTRWHIY